LMYHAEDGDTITFKLRKTNRENRNNVSLYTNNRGITGEAPYVQFPAAPLEYGVLRCLEEVDPMDILPRHDRAEDDVMVLSGQLAQVEKQLADIEAQIVSGGSVAVLVSAAKKLEAKKADINGKLADARRRVRNPQSEAWGSCYSLISALLTADDEELARTRLQSAIRAVVRQMNCMFARNGRRQFAVVQLKFHGSDAIRTVYIRYRCELTGRGFRRPYHMSCNTQLDGVPGMIDLTHPVHRQHVRKMIEGLCVEAEWEKHSEGREGEGACRKAGEEESGAGDARQRRTARKDRGGDRAAPHDGFPLRYRLCAKGRSPVNRASGIVLLRKVTVKDNRYTGILMGTVQAGIANGVLDAVRAGIIPKEKANDLGIIYSVWLDPSILSVPEGEIDHASLFKVNRDATVKVITKAMNGEPTIDWLLENQESVTHYFHQLGLEGKL
jgi:5,6,7,8-tetrahydromethanopterin hydro-lyase